MEARSGKMLVISPGGSASKNAESFRLNIPTKWARDMGVSREDRTVKISYENKRIIIEKDQPKE